MSGKRKFINILLLIFFFIIIINNISQAGFGINNLGGTNPESDNPISTLGNKLVTIITTVGVVTSIIVLIVLGIKYMAGSIEEKASYKQTLKPYLIGAIFTFAGSTIASIIYQIAKNI